jgi:hypothetical protein
VEAFRARLAEAIMGVHDAETAAVESIKVTM